jgi:3-hydroxy-9,10-secoandrosta-1,3,5(10)-triene-9,17-dione monooxygenase
MNMTVRDELLERARRLAPTLAERAQQTEDNRALLDENVGDLIDSGILATMTPRVYGGHEQDVDVMAEILRIISAACPSTGWVSAFYMGAPWRLNIFSEQAQREVFADKPYMLNSGQAAPVRETRKVPGGYRITGQAAWSSGSVHAQWIVFGGLIREEGKAPEPMTFLVPRKETTLVDTWFSSGMRGTGSNDMRVDDVFVPEYRAASLRKVLAGTTEGQTAHANPMYRRPFIPFCMCELVPVVVGITRGAADAFVQRTRDRQGTISGVKAAAKQLPQVRMAQGLAAADAAEKLLDAYLCVFMNQQAQEASLLERARMKLRAAYIVDLCRGAVNDMARGFGGDGFRNASPLQRYFRDINMLSVHAFIDFDTASESFGRLTLGQTVDDPLL